MSSLRRSALVLGLWMSVPVLVMAARVQAAEGTPPSEVVRYADLDLATGAGIRTLYSRIQRAADSVCEPFASSGTLIPSAAWRSCFNQAVAAAVRHVDRPLLTAYHESQQQQVLVPARLLSRAGE